MQPPNWNDFQAFLALARAGQLAGAAKILAVDSTTIGRRIRRLEVQIGQTLFERTREGQILTEAGEKLLATVEVMASAAASISAPDRGAGPMGTLRVSVPEGFGTRFLAPRLPEFTNLYPGLVVDLVANNNYLSLSKREADIAIFLARPTAGPLVATRLTRYTLGLFSSQEYLDKHGTPSSVTDLSRHQLIGYIPDLLPTPELEYLDEIQANLSMTVRSTSINAQCALVAAGMGIGVLPCFIGNTSRATVRILPEHRITRNFWLVMHKDTYQLQKIIAFKTWISQVVQREQPLLLDS